MCVLEWWCEKLSPCSPGTSLMGYQDTPLPFACLACCWASVLIQLFHFNGRSHFCLARPAAKLLSAARLLFLCTHLSIGGLHSSPLLEAALTTAPYAAAFLVYSLVIASLCEPRNTPNAFFTTNRPHRWRHFSRRTSAGILFSNYMMSAGVYTLVALTLTTEDRLVLSDLACASTMWHVNCFLVLAAQLGWVARGQASHGPPVTCCGAAVAVHSVLGLFCGCLCVQAGVTTLAFYEPTWFTRHFALAQGLFLTAELLPVLVLSAFSPGVDARAAAEPRRGVWGLNDVTLLDLVTRRDGALAQSADQSFQASAEEIDGAVAVRRAVRAALVTSASRGRPHARRLLRDARGQVGARDERAALHDVRELLRAERDAPPPLTPAVLGSLESTWLATDADDNCSICLECMSRGEEALQLLCQHAFHAACLRTWLARSGSCPLCKFDVANSCAPLADKEPWHKVLLRTGAVFATITAPGLLFRALRVLRMGVICCGLGVAGMLLFGMGFPGRIAYACSSWA